MTQQLISKYGKYLSHKWFVSSSACCCYLLGTSTALAEAATTQHHQQQHRPAFISTAQQQRSTSSCQSSRAALAPQQCVVAEISTAASTQQEGEQQHSSSSCCTRFIFRHAPVLLCYYVCREACGWMMALTAVGELFLSEWTTDRGHNHNKWQTNRDVVYIKLWEIERGEWRNSIVCVCLTITFMAGWFINTLHLISCYI